MNVSSKKVVIRGAYGYGNFGDDALMLAAYEVVKRALGSESIFFQCSESNYIQKQIYDAKVIPLDSKYVSTADILIYGGGTQFYSFPLTCSTVPDSIMLKIVDNLRQPVRVFKKIIFKIKQFAFFKPKQIVAAIGIGLGPFVENHKYIAITKGIFTRMDLVAVREMESYDLCKKWGCNNLTLSTDLCYLRGLWELDIPKSHTDNMVDKFKRIGVVVRDWPHTYEGNSYIDSLLEVVDELRLLGKKVEFISFAEKSDNEWVKRLESRGELFTVWRPLGSSVSSFLNLLAGYDAFITARYHGAVFASILKKPVVCIEVEQKLGLIANLLGNGARLWTYPFSSIECLNHISDLEATYSDSVECLARVVNEQGVLADKVVEDLRILARPSQY